MDKLKDMFKGLPKWAWWVIGGGGLFLLYFGLKSNRSSATTEYSLATPPAGSGTGGTTENSQVINALNDKLTNLANQVNEQSGTYMEGLAAVQKSTNETIAHQNETFTSTISSLTNSIKESNESTRNQLGDVLHYVDQSNKQLADSFANGLNSSRESVSALTSTVSSLMASRDAEEQTVYGSVSTNPVASTSYQPSYQPASNNPSPSPSSKPATPAPKNYGVIAANTPATSTREAEIIRKAQQGQMPTSNLTAHEKELVHQNWQGRAGG